MKELQIYPNCTHDVSRPDINKKAAYIPGYLNSGWLYV